MPAYPCILGSILASDGIAVHERTIASSSRHFYNYIVFVCSSLAVVADFPADLTCIKRKNTMEPLLNMDETAALMKLTKAQLYEICRSRSRSRQSHPIPVIVLGKRRMFRATALHEWILKLERGTNG
jgi:hypothetical protein